MKRLRRATLCLTVPCFALTALAACGPDDNRLFKEPGVWAVTHYSEDGAVLNPVPAMTQEDAFLFNFDRDKGILATAACSFQGGDNTPAASTCGVAASASEQEWECKCFSYEFDNDVIRMTGFAPGQAAPPVGSSDTDGSGDTTEVMVAEYVEVSNSYSFTPLPGPSELDLDGLFGSNGVNSVYVFKKRFEGIFEDTGCAAACFGE